MSYYDYSEYGEAAYLERMYEQHMRDEQRRLLATVTTPEEDARARQDCEVMAAEAKAQAEVGTYSKTCIAGEPVFYYSYPKALIPGHIYTTTGVDEFNISRSCEYHFDQWFPEEDDDDYIPED